MTSPRTAATTATRTARTRTSPRRRRRGRRGGRGRRRKPKALEGTFDHGDEGFGLWLDPAVQDDAVYAEHWAGHRPVTVTVEPDRIVISRAGEESDEDDDDSEPPAATLGPMAYALDNALFQWREGSVARRTPEPARADLERAAEAVDRGAAPPARLELRASTSWRTSTRPARTGRPISPGATPPVATPSPWSTRPSTATPARRPTSPAAARASAREALGQVLVRGEALARARHGGRAPRGHERTGGRAASRGRRQVPRSSSSSALSSSRLASAVARPASSRSRAE